MSQPPFVTDIIITEPVIAGTPSPIVLQGQWPTPAWDHVDTVIDVNEEKQQISISYLGKAGSGMAIQVIDPFEDTVMVNIPHAGNWTIKFKGRSGDQIKSFNVIED